MDREYVVSMACTNAEKFTEEMHLWLRNSDNWKIWRAFEAKANEAWDDGRRKYSSKTIIEFLRQHTPLKDSCSEFKINDHVQPDLARLYLVLYPERCRFFTLRFRRKAEAA